MALLKRLGMTIPIFQAPMAGVATPSLAAAVSNAGGLGGLGVGTAGVAEGRKLIVETRKLTDRAFNLNVFVHATPAGDSDASAHIDKAWSNSLQRSFADCAFDEKLFVPTPRTSVPKSFLDNREMLDMLLETRPPVVSFHFGLPPPDVINSLRDAGCILLATATNLDELRRVEEAGLDGVVAQGIEAGGHRGMFDPGAQDEKYETMDLVRMFAHHASSTSRSRIPIIAAGGIMDGRMVRAALEAGAEAAQLGTAFIACPESGADDAYRKALVGTGGYKTTYTTFVSGRAARGLPNRFTELQFSEEVDALQPLDFPVSYAMSKALAKAAKERGIEGFAARWAGKNAPMARTMPAEELMRTLAKELDWQG